MATFAVSKFYLYTSFSLLAVAYKVHEAFTLNRQVYPTVVSLTNSKAFSIILGNGAVALLMLVWTAIRKLFFGNLELSERSKLVEVFFTFSIETIVALTYFRSSTTTALTAQLALTMAVKLFHALAAARIETMERTVGNNVKEFTFLSAFLVLLLNLDGFCVVATASRLRALGITPHILILLEFTLMFISCVTTTIKLALFQLEVLRRDEVWEAKGTARFYTEIAQSLLNFVVYITFFSAMCTITTFPLHLVRELYINVVHAATTLRNFSKYRKLANNIDHNFRDATNEELEEDRTCAICYDEMLNDSRVKRLPCGHMFHRHCLRRWFEKNTICPYCRRDTEELLRMAGQQQQQQEQREHMGGVGGAGGDAAQPEVQPPLPPRPPNDHMGEAAYELYRLLVVQARLQNEAARLAAAPAPEQQQQQQQAQPREAESGSMTPLTRLELPPQAAQATGGPATIPPSPVSLPPAASDAPPLAVRTQQQQQRSAIIDTPSPAVSATAATSSAEPVRQPEFPAAPPLPEAPLAARSRLLQRQTSAQLQPASPRQPDTPLTPADAEELEAYREYHETVAQAQRQLHARLERARSTSMSWSMSSPQ